MIDKHSVGFFVFPLNVTTNDTVTRWLWLDFFLLFYFHMLFSIASKTRPMRGHKNCIFTL